MKSYISNPHLLVALILLLTAALVVGCGAAEPAEQPAPAISVEQAMQATPAGSVEPAEQPTLATSEEPAEQPSPVIGEEPASPPMSATVGEPTRQPTPANGGDSQPAPQSIPQNSETEHIIYMVKLLAEADVNDYWFLDLASIRADPDLAPLAENLADTWNGWNEASSDEVGLTLHDAAFAVSLPGGAIFLGGIEDLEGLRETVAGLGYEQRDVKEVVYWVYPDQEYEKWGSLTFLPNGIVMIMGGEPDYFLEDVINLVKYGVWDEDDDWQRYVDRLRGNREESETLDIGSIDDVVSVIDDSLMFHLDYSNDIQSMWTREGSGTIKEVRILSYPDDDSAKEAEAETKEGQALMIAEAERVAEKPKAEATAEERYMLEYLSACGDHQIIRNGKELALTQVCRVDWFDFRYANYLLSAR